MYKIRVGFPGVTMVQPWHLWILRPSGGKNTVTLYQYQLCH